MTGRGGARWTIGCGRAPVIWGAASARGEIDPVALTEAYLDASAVLTHRDRIYTVLTPERALAEAKAAAERAKNGVRRGLLDGVPISWKDLFDSAGVATEAGSRLLEGRVPDADAEVLARATRAGLVCLGKTHMSELAFAGLGLNPPIAARRRGRRRPTCNDRPACRAGRPRGRRPRWPSGLRRRASDRTPADRCGHPVGVERPGGAQDHVGAPVAGGRRAACRKLRHGRPALPQRWRIARICWR
jgi:hypothetical protein